MPAISRLVYVDRSVTRAGWRSYERGLAAAVLGTSGLAAARTPLLTALAAASEDSDRILFVVALARLRQHGESPEFLLEALAKTPAEAQVASRAFSRCGEDLACHVRSLGEPRVDESHYRSSMFVAARAAPDQGPAVLAQMERMSRPQWLAHALDQRLPQPSQEDLVRVQKLTRHDPKGAALFASRP